MGFLGFHHIGTFLLFAAMALFIVVSVSSPIWHQLNLLKVHGTTNDITFGVFGYCTGTNGSYTCSSRTLGYPISSVISNSTGTTYANSSLDRATKVLLLNPIAAGITAIAFLIAGASHRLGFIFAALVGVVAWVVSAAAMAVDLYVCIMVKNHINDDTSSTASYGIMLWLAVAGCGAVFLGTITTFFSCCTDNRRKRRDLEY